MTGLATHRRLLGGTGVPLLASAGFWRAADYDPATGTIPDLSGNNHALTVDAAAKFLAFGATKHLWFPGAAGNYLSTPNAVESGIVAGGDNDTRVAFQADDWTPAANQTICAVWVELSNRRSFRLQLLTTGVLRWEWSRFGDAASSFTVDSTVAVPAPTAGTFRLIRVSHDVSVPPGAVGLVTFLIKTVTDETTISAELDNDNGWVPLGAPVNTTAAARFQPATTPFTAGADGDGVSNPAAGTVHGVWTGGGTIATPPASASYWADTSVVVQPAATFVETSGNNRTVTIMRAAAGFKTAFVDRRIIVNGGASIGSVGDLSLYEYAAGAPFSTVAALRRYGTPGAAEMVGGKRVTAASSAVAGHALRVETDRTTRAVVGDGTSVNVAVGGALSDGVASLVVMRRGGGFLDMRVAGTTGSSVPATAGATANASTLSVGASAAATEACEQEFVAFGVFSQALTDDQATTVALYLGVAG